MPPRTEPSVAPNLVGRLHPPVERLRLGVIHDGRYPGLYVTGGEALFWVYIPTSEGGELTIELEPGARARIRVLAGKDRIISESHATDRLVTEVLRFLVLRKRYR